MVEEVSVNHFVDDAATTTTISSQTRQWETRCRRNAGSIRFSNHFVKPSQAEDSWLGQCFGMTPER